MAGTTPLPEGPSAEATSALVEDPLIGMRLNNIELVRRLEEGGMGAIYLGVHRELNKEYAVKVSTREDDPTLEGRALREAKALSQLDHPNIVQVFDACTLADGRLAIVMPLLSGNTLAWHAARKADGSSRSVPVKEAVHIALQLAMGLAEAHRNGFVHRDLKPGNVFVTLREVELEGVRGPEVKLLDFGLVRVSQMGWQPLNPDEADQSGAPARTIAGGTPEYVSPEQCTGTPHIDGRADLYGLGVLLFELLAGRLPFVPPAGMDPRAQVVWLMRQHFKEPAPRVTVFAEKVPRPLEALVAQLLEKAPGARPQTAKEVEQRLREVLRALTQEQGRVAGGGRWRPAAVAAGVAALFVLAWLGLVQKRPPQDPVEPLARPEVQSPLPAVPPPLPAPPPPLTPAPVVEAPPTPAPAPAPPPSKPTRKGTTRKPARVAAAGGCTPDDRWRSSMRANIQELAQVAKEDSQRFARFRRIEVRLSPLVRDASTAADCAQAKRLLEDLKAAASP